MSLLLIALGAAVGAPLRYLTDRAIQARFGTDFGWGTLTVNVAGSLLVGVVMAVPAGPAITALVVTGFCGALTTYSTFGYETVQLARARRRGAALANVLLSLVAGWGAAWLGYAAARAWTG